MKSIISELPLDPASAIPDYANNGMNIGSPFIPSTLLSPT